MQSSDEGWSQATTSPVQSGAVYIFPTLNAFLKGEPDQYRQAFGNPSTNFATPKYSGFIQDHWTLTSRLTIDAGIRYDFEHLPAQFREDTNDFAPRIGLAFSPSPLWLLRAGFGVFFDRYLLAAVNRALEKNGVQAFEQVAYGQAATQIFQSELGGSTGNPIPSIRPSIFTADPNLQTSRSEITSAGVERSLTRNLTASATYLFARGRGLWDRHVGSRKSSADILTQALSETMRGVTGPRFRLSLVVWRNIATTLKIPPSRLGERTAQACEMAWFRKLSMTLELCSD